MAKLSHILPLSLALMMASAQVCLAETRAEGAIHAASDTRIADLPAGHWATNATQVVVANNILALDADGSFQGNRALSTAELAKAMDGLATTAENIASKGANTPLRASIASLPSGSGVSRLELSQSLANFLDACASQGLVAIAAPTHDAGRFKDLGASVPASVITVVDTYKVMSGHPDNTFHPNDQVTRFQMAAISLNVLNAMRMAPIAQLPVVRIIETAAVAPEPIIVLVPEKPAVVVAAGPTVRPNFRAKAPFHLDWQAVNSNNVTGGNPFGVVPFEGMITAYQGPLMLQNVTNLRVNVFQDNMVDSEFRVGLSELKLGMFQAIPYVGALVGLGTSVQTIGTQYDSYVGATYGGILSMMPTDTIELHAQLGQSALLAGGRFNSQFQPTAYPNALGSMLSSYGVGADFYVAPNMCLSFGVNTWQDPASLRSGNDDAAGGVINTLGGSVGLGSTF